MARPTGQRKLVSAWHRDYEPDPEKSIQLNSMITVPLRQRFMDLAVAVPLLVVATPVLLVLLTAIRIESPGAPLFVQQRVGKQGRIFSMLKLRTMRAGTPNRASHQVAPSQITGLGGLLRRLKLDELPQLWNVLAGQMSLVGPRPCLPNQHELLAERAARGLLAIRPGVTGPAQLVGLDMSDPVRLAEAEAAYFSRSRAISDDVGLIVRTLIGGGRGDAARRISKEPVSKAPKGD